MRLAFSNTGEFLAVSLVKDVGVHILTNRTLFTHIPTRQISSADVASIDTPSASTEGAQGLVASAFDSAQDEEQLEAEYGGSTASVEQISDNLLTLSLVPRNQWQTLLHLDLVRQRNKPKEPPKPPEKAPFFLPPLQPHDQSGSRQADASEEAQTSTLTTMSQSRVLALAKSATTTFTNLLHAAISSSDYGPFISHLKELTPSTADLEIRSLNPRRPHTELIGFIRALTYRLQSKLDYELVQVWMSVFLRAHADVVVSDESLMKAVREWRGEQEKEAARLRELVGFCSGVVGYLRSART
jgi:U3 small nucleolar RNA-associated protein 21